MIAQKFSLPIFLIIILFSSLTMTMPTPISAQQQQQRDSSLRFAHATPYHDNISSLSLGCIIGEDHVVFMSSGAMLNNGIVKRLAAYTLAPLALAFTSSQNISQGSSNAFSAVCDDQRAYFGNSAPPFQITVLNKNSPSLTAGFDPQVTGTPSASLLDGQFLYFSFVENGDVLVVKYSSGDSPSRISAITIATNTGGSWSAEASSGAIFDFNRRLGYFPYFAYQNPTNPNAGGNSYLARVVLGGQNFSLSSSTPAKSPFKVFDAVRLLYSIFDPESDLAYFASNALLFPQIAVFDLNPSHQFQSLGFIQFPQTQTRSLSSAAIDIKSQMSYWTDIARNGVVVILDLKFVNINNVSNPTAFSSPNITNVKAVETGDSDDALRCGLYSSKHSALFASSYSQTTHPFYASYARVVAFKQIGTVTLTPSLSKRELSQTESKERSESESLPLSQSGKKSWTLNLPLVAGLAGGTFVLIMLFLAGVRYHAARRRRTSSTIETTSSPVLPAATPPSGPPVVSRARRVSGESGTHRSFEVEMRRNNNNTHPIDVVEFGIVREDHEVFTMPSPQFFGGAGELQNEHSI